LAYLREGRGDWIFRRDGRNEELGTKNGDFRREILVFERIRREVILVKNIYSGID